MTTTQTNVEENKSMQRMTDLEPRRLPSQERSRRRVDAILDALAELLVERGFDSINTHHVAERAGVPVGTLYQFFPNKYALLTALSRRYITRYAQIMQDQLSEYTDVLSWDALQGRIADVIAGPMFEDKAMSVLWAVTQATPELRPLLEEGMSMSLALITGELKTILPHLPNDQIDIIGKTVNRVSYALLYAACQGDAQEKQTALRELKRVSKAYIQTYIAKAETSA